MFANIWKLSKTGWRIFLNGTGEQQLIAGIAIGAIASIEKAALAIYKTKKLTKELLKKSDELNKESEKLIAQAEKDFSEEKEIEERLEEAKQKIEEANKNDLMKKYVERLVKQADRLCSED
jgi:hypothetical protein